MQLRSAPANANRQHVDLARRGQLQDALADALLTRHVPAQALALDLYVSGG